VKTLLSLPQRKRRKKSPFIQKGGGHKKSPFKKGGAVLGPFFKEGRKKR
jgi:hypothetical protein